MDLREELMVRVLITLKNDYEIDTQDARNKLVFILNDYNVGKVSTALVTTDIHEKLHLFLAIKKLEGLTKGSIENYRSVIIDFSRYIFKPVSQVDTMDIRKYLATYYDRVKATTLNSKLSKLRGFFEWLSSEGYIETNPAKSVAPMKVESRMREALTLEQMEQLRECCITKREKAVVEFLYSTGCRVSEVVKVKVGDLNFNEMSLRVIGKGNKERKVYFNERAKIHLLTYLKGRQSNVKELFERDKGIGELGRQSILREVKGVAERMEYPVNVYPHLFRHTFASHAINAGVPVEVVQRLLGHASPATTIIYAKLDDTTIKQEYRKF